MSLVESENIAEEYDWNEPDKHDPSDIGKGWSFDGAEGICQYCFGKIIQPIIQGIWYHKDSYNVKQKDHEPTPASEIFQLFFYFMQPSKAYDSYEKSKKCKHSRWWSDVLDFKPMNEGVHDGHFFMSHYQTVCGRIADLRKRKYLQTERAEFPTSGSMFDFGCEKCLAKLEKLEMIKIYWNGKYSYSRTKKIKWIKKKLPKSFISDAKAKYTKVLK